MTKNKSRLVFLPLGGSGEIGMNMNLFGYGAANQESWIMVDCGVTFGDSTTPGVELIFPNYDFIKQRRKQLLAIVLTHAHEDHIGAIAHVWPDLMVPMYATPFTVRMMQDKFNERGINVEGFLHTIPLKSKLTIGDFGIEFVSITHSIPEPNGLYITTPAGKIYHTGDWKFDANPVLGDATDFKRIAEIAKLGVDACICDSTNALDAGVSGSESDILQPMIDAINSCDGRVAITTFASNVARMKTLIMAATAAGRKYVLLGRSVERIYEHGRQMGYFGGVPDPIDIESCPDIPAHQLVCICTGSQGEQRAALGRIARDNHPFFKMHAGDTVIFSSKAIPGNEKAISLIYNQLAHKNVNILTSKMLDIHVSGHPCADELASLYQQLQPTSAIPVHGEQRHMVAHAQIALDNGAKNAIIPQNGDMIEITPDGVAYVDKIKAGRVYVDGYICEDSVTGSSSNRNRLGYSGYASIVAVIDDRGGLLSDFVVQSFGIPDEKLLYPLIDNPIVSELKNAYYTFDVADYNDDEKLGRSIKQAYRKIINNKWGKKPITDVKIVRLGASGITAIPKPSGAAKKRRRRKSNSGGNPQGHAGSNAGA